MTLRLVSLSSTPSTRTPTMLPNSRRSSSLGTCSPLRSGSVNQNCEPLPTVLSAPICPPMASTSPLAMDRPRPVPPCLLVVEGSACTNGLNSCSSTGAGIPMPLSRTVKRMIAPLSSSDFRITCTSTSPSSVNLMALPTRLVSIWRNRPGSPRRAGGHVGLDQHSQLDALLVRLDGQQGHHVLQGEPEIEVDVLELHLLGLDLGEVQDVADDGEQGLGARLDGLGVVPLLLVELGVQQQVDHADDAVHGRADLVAHVGEEGALGLAGRLSFDRQLVGALDGVLQLPVGGLGLVLGQPQLGLVLLALA